MTKAEAMIANYETAGRGTILGPNGELQSVRGSALVPGYVLAERIALALRRIDALQEAVNNTARILEDGPAK